MADFFSDLFSEFAGVGRTFDNVFVYLAMLALGLFFFMIFIKNVHNQFLHPQEYYAVDFETKMVIGFMMFLLYFAFVFFNLTRFFS
jgi:hypothetical protein